MRLFRLRRSRRPGNAETPPSNSSPTMNAWMLDESGAPPIIMEEQMNARNGADGNYAVAAMKTLSDPMAQHAYDCGVADGRDRVVPESFSRYVQLSVLEEEARENLANIESQEAELHSQLTTIQEQHKSLAKLNVETENLGEQIERTKDQLKLIEGDLKMAQADRDRVRGIGFPIYATIFLVASLAFMLADVVITRKIVADALELTGQRIMGLDEGWYFAIALALLAVLLKPAYDRLVEDPYWDGRRRVFNWTIICASVLALATLVVLGVFRGTAFEAQTLGELQQQAPDADPAQTWEALRQLQEEIVRSWWGRLAFIMSGVLFAIAGAISLGISLRHFQDWWHVKKPAAKRHKDLENQRQSLQKKDDGLVSARIEKLAELRQTEAILKIGPDLVELREQLKLVKDALPDMRDRYFQIRKERISSVYTNGHSQGSQLSDSKSVKEPSKPRRKRPRPYVAIRRDIRGMLSNPIHDAGSGT